MQYFESCISPVVQSQRRPLLGPSPGSLVVKLGSRRNYHKGRVGAFSMIVQPVVERMEHYTALVSGLGWLAGPPSPGGVVARVGGPRGGEVVGG